MLKWGMPRRAMPSATVWQSSWKRLKACDKAGRGNFESLSFRVWGSI